ncbi:phosphoribosylanthranilate isomerase [Companilactobacillus allii]|uniref:N-(5'-phosphoribosyl)anthranilate isomerase n=1 Tax=Companilactobacillus allii TaxID=1847728 RepID=A0A1P8Q3D9_9LACO|nr:phosphoribosylanthranilate isomerase [Companilactobacillus allii]APX72347.1 N-(5'-phosphoribosyl)anthranilate isomerase [Companilactobacillus allii]USQ69439.1 phosphoribosylanthranilate isomerase [Companilactobacillus allii]
MTKIKICGLMTIEDIDAVNQAKPDFAGFIFAGGRHHIDLDQAIKLREHLDPRIISVGVFVDAPIEEILKAVNSGAISIVQLHGNESEEVVDYLHDKNIKVIQVFNPTDEKFNTGADYTMLDSDSGEILDWKNLLIIPDILAGSINSANVDKAIKIVKPKIIDVSRGVETNGKKDINKIRQIVNEVHNS